MKDKPGQIELVQLHVEINKRSLGEDYVKRLYIDGGFSDDDSFIKLLSHYLGGMELCTATSSLEATLGGCYRDNGKPAAP